MSALKNKKKNKKTIQRVSLTIFFTLSIAFPSQLNAATVIDLATNAPDIYISKTTSYGTFAHMGGVAVGDVNGDGIKDTIASALVEKITRIETGPLPTDKDSWTESGALASWRTTTTKNTTPVADTQTFIAGSASISTTRTAVGTVTLKISSSSGLFLNPSSDILHFQLYAQDPNEQIFYIDIWAPDYNNRFRYNLSLPLNDSAWTQLDIPLTNFTVASGSPAWNNVRGVLISFLNGRSGDIKIDQFYFDYNGPVTKKAGLVYLFFGPVSGAKTVAQANVLIPGIDEGDLTGEYLEIKDINQDGYGDIIIGVSGDDGPGNTRIDAGAVYIVFGKGTLPATIDIKTEADYIIYGADAGDLLGETVYAADVNGDNIADLILGAQNADGYGNTSTYNGEVHIIYGSPTLVGILDLNSQAANISVYGERFYDYLGFQSTIGVGDIYNDGQKDLILGVWGGDKSPYLDTGRVIVIDDISNYVGAINLATTPPTTTIYGADTGDRLTKVAIADFNKDGIDDILAGAESADGLNNSKTDSGEVYVIFGSLTLPTTIDLNSTAANIRIVGKNAGDNLGLKVYSGDINNDTNADLLFIASGSEGLSNTKNNCGAGYALYGNASLNGTIDLSLEPVAIDLIVYGADSDDNLRDVYSSDISGDGIADLILGFRDADGIGNAYPMSGEIVGIKGR